MFRAIHTASSLTWADSQRQLCARRILCCLIVYLYCWIFHLLIGLYQDELVIMDVNDWVTVFIFHQSACRSIDFVVSGLCALCLAYCMMFVLWAIRSYLSVWNYQSFPYHHHFPFHFLPLIFNSLKVCFEQWISALRKSTSATVIGCAYGDTRVALVQRRFYSGTCTKPLWY